MKKEMLACSILILSAGCFSEEGPVPPEPLESELVGIELINEGMMGRYETTISEDKRIEYSCGHPLGDQFEQSSVLSDRDFTELQRLVSQADMLSRESLGDEECADKIYDGASLSITVTSTALSNSLHLSNYAPDECRVPDAVQAVVQFVYQLRGGYFGEEGVSICPTVEIF